MSKNILNDKDSSKHKDEFHSGTSNEKFRSDDSSLENGSNATNKANNSASNTEINASNLSASLSDKSTRNPPSGVSQTVSSANVDSGSESGRGKAMRRKMYLRIAAISFLLSCLFAAYLYKQYSEQPQGSILDRMIIFFLQGRPYRDYLMLSEISTIEGGVYTLLTKDPAFSIKIPRQLFIRPGIIFTDSIPNPNYGMMEISDVFGNYLSWTWARLGTLETARANANSNSLDKVIRSRAQDFLKKQDENGFMLVHQEELHLHDNQFVSNLPQRTPITKANFHEHFPHQVHFSILVKDKEENEPGYFKKYPTLIPSSECWQGCAFFVYGDHIFVTSVSYPNNLINFAILKEHIQDVQSRNPDITIAQEFEKEIHEHIDNIADVNARNKMVAQINGSTFDHELIIQHIRESLIERLTEFTPERPPNQEANK